MKKRLFFFLLTAILLVGVFVPAANAASPAGNVAEGTCGTGLTWVLDNAGALTVSGTGDMTDFSSLSAVPWASYRSTIQYINVAYGVTSIGDYAFAYCSALKGTQIALPTGITSIGMSAFESCSTMTGIALPNSVTSIGKSAFSRCAGLTSISIPNSVTSIGNHAFSSCTGLTSITIPGGVTSIGVGAFMGCSNLTAIRVEEGNTYYSDIDGVLFDKAQSNLICFPAAKPDTAYALPSGVTSIGDYAFYTCTNLTSITLSDSVASIGYGAFKNCTDLTSITIPASVTRIGFYAFQDCSSLMSITIPVHVTSIGRSVFKNCTGLTSITIPASVTSIDSTAFEGCTNLTIHGYASSVAETYATENSIPFEAIPGPITGTYGENLTWALDDAGTLTISGTGVMWNYGSDNKPWGAYMESITSAVIEEGVTSIGSYAFANCANLKTVTLPDSLTSIGTVAFLYCENLTTLHIPAGVTWIGNYAFSECNSLTTITVAAENTAFSADENGVLFNKDKTVLLNYPDGKTDDSYTIPTGVTTIGTGAFNYCDFTTVIIPEGVLVLDGNAFEKCENLTDITIPFSVTDLQNSGLSGSPNLTIHGYTGTAAETYATDHAIPFEALSEEHILARGTCGEYITWILDKSGTLTISGKWTMSGYTSTLAPWDAYKEYITTVVIHREINSVGKSAFKDCTALKNVSLPAGLTHIGESAFEGCTALTNISLPTEDIYIGISAFEGCTALTNISIPAKVTYIGAWAFKGCTALKTIVLPEGLTDIGVGAFSGCTALVDVTLPDSLTSIGTAAFIYCENLTSLHIPAGVTQIGRWAFSECTSLPAITVAEENPVFSADENGVLFDKAQSMLICFPVAKADTAYAIPSGVTSIDDYAFEYCVNLKTVTLPDSLTSIGTAAFIYCENLTSLHIPAGVTQIGRWAFSECTSLPAITVAEENPVFSADENGVLFNKDKTTLIYYPDGKTDDSYTIPDGVLVIGQDAFSYCDFSTVIIPEGVTTIKSYAFEQCENLTAITIPSSVTSIGTGAFLNCSNLVIYGVTGSAADTYAQTNGISFVDPNPPTNDTCGENLTWILDDTGTLTISGTGEMLNYNRNTMPWKGHLESITSVVIEEGVTSIGNCAFFGCTNLSSITISDSLTSIGRAAFLYCENLTSLHIPAGVTQIGRWAFSECTSLPAITVAEENPVFSADENGVLFNKDKTTLIYYPDGKTDDSYTIPDGVLVIGQDAFSYCDFSTVIIPEGVTTIESKAFEECANLTKVIIPASVTSINDYAFQRCTVLTIHGYAGSAAETYATENNIPFVVIAEEQPITVIVNLPSSLSGAVTAPAGGWKVGTNTFSVKAENPCVIAVSYDGGKTYTRLTATANDDGGYNFTAENMTADTIVAVAVRGDANGDGKKNAADLAVLRAVLLGKISFPSALQELAGDGNSNNKVEAADLAVLRAILLSKISIGWT